MKYRVYFKNGKYFPTYFKTKKRLSIRLSSVEKSSARLAANGAATKKGLDKSPGSCYNVNTIKKGTDKNETLLI